MVDCVMKWVAYNDWPSFLSDRLHLRVHHDDKRYECDECGKTFIRHDHLTKHQKIHSGSVSDVVWLVSFAQTSFCSNLNQPVFVTGEKAHQCEECGKCFRRHDHLTVHYKSIHLGEKVWQKYVDTRIVHAYSKFCQNPNNHKVWQFPLNTELVHRYKTAVHQCEVCKKEFKGKSSLEMHFRTHSGKEANNAVAWKGLMEVFSTGYWVSPASP